MSSQGKEPRCWALSRHFSLEEFNLKDVFLQGPEVLSKDLLKISAPPSNFLPDPHLRRQQRLEHHQHWGLSVCLDWLHVTRARRKCQELPQFASGRAVEATEHCRHFRASLVTREEDDGGKVAACHKNVPNLHTVFRAQSWDVS